MRPPSVTQESLRSHPCPIAPVLIILLNLPLSDGVSAYTKATSGSLAVQGCGLRYLGTPHHALQHRTSRSLYAGADLRSGILTREHNALKGVFFKCSVYHTFFLMLRGTRHYYPRMNSEASAPMLEGLAILSVCRVLYISLQAQYTV